MLRVFVAPISVDINDSSEQWAIDDAYVKVNCDPTNFKMMQVGLLDMSL